MICAGTAPAGAKVAPQRRAVRHQPQPVEGVGGEQQHCQEEQQHASRTAVTYGRRIGWRFHCESVTAVE